MKLLFFDRSGFVLVLKRLTEDKFRCGVEPLAWLRHVLTELPQRPENVAIDDLLPFNFLKAAAA